MQNTEDKLSVILGQLAERIEAETGLSFPQFKRRDLMLGIGRMAESLGLDSDEECIDWLLAGGWEKSKTDLCAHHLTIGETYFFREQRAFGLVVDYAKEKLASQNSRLRIWSAGCCTGEEPYSIAMALKRALPALDPRQVSILGSDINPQNLQIARDAVYRHWSFRNTDIAVQRKNFTEKDGRYQLSEEIRAMVKFSQLNLAATVYPSIETDTQALDIIFCRNVLMYFSKSQAQKVIERFRQCLVHGGWLIVSPSEASSEMFSGFSGVYYPDAIFFRKNHPSAAPAPAPAPSPALPSFRGAEPIPTFVEEAVPSPLPARARLEIARDPVASPEPAAMEPDTVRRARMFADEGNTTEAMKCLRRAIKDRPLSADLYLASAQVAMEAGDKEEALQSIKRFIYLHPDSVMGHFLLGVVHSSQQRKREATRSFETACGLLATLDEDEPVEGSEGLSAKEFLQHVRNQLRKDSA